MSDATLESQHDTHADHGDHPTEASYWQIFAILAVITAAEVAWSYFGLEGPALVLPLVVMMIVKFFLVAGYFMHLKYDWAIIHGKTFAMMFSFGLVLAIAVYLTVVATFDFQI